MSFVHKYCDEQGSEINIFRIISKILCEIKFRNHDCSQGKYFITYKVIREFYNLYGYKEI